VKTCILSVFTDGTKNDKDVDFPRGSATNIARLYMLSKEGTEGDEDFRSFYIRGVGTSQGWDPALGGSIGMGFQDRVQKALRWIGESASKHPQAEIVVDLFGFSRGAAEAMQLTNSLHDPAMLASHRMKDREMETGAPPRGPTGNEPEPKIVVQTRIEKAYAERLRSGQPGTYNPGIRCRDNGLSRIYLWIMKTQAEKAGVVWKRQDEVDEDHWKSIKPLPATHPLHSLHVYSTQPELLAGIVETELFWTTVVPSMHDSRWSDDVISHRRKRGVIFDGRGS
jgi:uncharacterized protein (DUF4415 family)